MNQSRQNWEIYERMIASLFANQSETGLCVTPNARVTGAISGRSRQIDLLIDARHDTDNSRRVIVDAKNRKRKIDVTDVERFLGLMKDVNATHGYLVSPSGHTKAAEKRSQMAVTIRIIPTNRLEGFDPSAWPRCNSPCCKHGRVFWDGYPELTMKLRFADSIGKEGSSTLSFVHYVGKCDRCGHFHVWCTSCGDILFVPENDEDGGHQCRCRLPWFWLASIERDGKGYRSAELHAIFGAKVMTVDRRPL